MEEDNTMVELTMREWMILSFISNYIKRNGYAPTSCEIGASIGKKQGAGITYTLCKLGEKGVIKHKRGRSCRAIAIVHNITVGVTP